MNVKKIYEDAITPKEPVVEVKETVDPDSIILQQEIFKWKSSPVNEQYLIKLDEQISSLLDDAMKLAVSYHLMPNNPQQIINKLVQAETLRKVVNDHAPSHN